MLKAIRTILNGLAFGITETVPGVSGGTIAIMLGFYDELITAISRFTKDWRKYLKFLLLLFAGVAGGVLVFSSLMKYLIFNYSFPTMLFFIGLVFGIIPNIFFKVKEPGRRFTPGEVILILIPVIVLTAISVIKGFLTEPAVAAEAVGQIGVPFMLFLFFAGMLAAAALIIPGISGSFMLLLLGIYPLAINTLSSVKDLLLDIRNTELLLDICKVLGPLGIGIVIGGISMAKLIGRLLKNHNKTVYLIILGLLIGSIYTLFNEPIVYQSGVTPPVVAIGIFALLLGGLLSFSLGRKRF